MTHSVLRAFILVALILSLFPVGSVGAEVMPGCSMTPTVEALRACMQHCYESGEITNAKVAGSLLGELQAAQVAVDREHPRAGIYLLELFVREVRSLSGRYIAPAHAAHMIEHATQVIRALKTR